MDTYKGLWSQIYASVTLLLLETKQKLSGLTFDNLNTEGKSQKQYNPPNK